MIKHQKAVGRNSPDSRLSSTVTVNDRRIKMLAVQLLFHIGSVAPGFWRAQEHPQNYKNLVVRVAGFSSYFTRLYKGVQDEIIKRTEYQNV